MKIKDKDEGVFREIMKSLFSFKTNEIALEKLISKFEEKATSSPWESLARRIRDEIHWRGKESHQCGRRSPSQVNARTTTSAPSRRRGSKFFG